MIRDGRGSIFDIELSRRWVDFEFLGENDPKAPRELKEMAMDDGRTSLALSMVARARNQSEALIARVLLMGDWGARQV